jgi:hypothetical protein
MAIELLTKEDLRQFKQELITEIKKIFPETETAGKKWLKSDEVRRLLRVSHGTLQTLRNNKTLQFTKIGGTIYYPYDEIVKMMKGVRV